MDKKQIKWTGERIVWDNPKEHLDEIGKVFGWYLEAMKYVNKRDIVIDVACGTGFGTFMLDKISSQVHGIDKLDMDWESKLPYERTTFHIMDLDKDAVDITADIAVSIETIEHLENPDFFLKNLKAKSLFFTIPCYGDKHNTFHVIEYSEEKARDLISKYYDITYRMERGRMIGYGTRI